MSEALISTMGLTKYYGKTLGVEDLDLKINKGEIYGFLGPNGAGKTTTIRMLLDFIRPTKGSAEIFGLNAHRDTVKIKRSVGYLPGELELYRNMRGADILHHFSYLRGGVDWQYVKELADRLDYDITKPIKSLSSGNKHKLGIIQAFMHKPELLILDEPTTGLDPLMQQEFNEMLRESQKDGQTTFVSSHILPEVERICDRVGFIRNGRLIDVRHISDLKERALRQIEIVFDGPVKEEVFSGLPGIKDVSVKGSVLSCTMAGSLDSVVKAAANFTVIDIISREPNLEDLFLTYYGGEQNAAS